METNLSQLRRSYLEAERALDAIEVQRTELQDKIKQAISNGKTENLPQLRAELVSLESLEVPLAQANSLEAAIRLHEAESGQLEHELEAARAHLDLVSNRRNEEMQKLSEQYHALQLDQSGEIAQAHKMFLDAQHAVAKSKEQAQQYREHLAQAKQQQSAAL